MCHSLAHYVFRPQFVQKHTGCDSLLHLYLVHGIHGSAEEFSLIPTHRFDSMVEGTEFGTWAKFTEGALQDYYRSTALRTPISAPNQA